MIYIKHSKGLGIAYDLLNVFIEYYFNKENLSQLKIFFDFDDLSNECQLFFQKNDNGITTIEKILELGINKFDINDENYVIKCIQIDSIEIINIVLSHHFGIEKTINNLHQLDIKSVNSEIKKLKTSDDLKSSFYSFFIDPINTINVLNKDIANIYEQICLLYKLKGKKSTKEIEEIIANNIDEEILLSKNIYYSYSLIFKEKCYIYNLASMTIIVCGINYKKANDKIELAEIGNVLADKSRLKILDILLEHSICNINEINSIMNMNNTTLFYHLSIMVKSGLIKREARGKIIYYSLDKSFIENVLNHLKCYGRL